MKLFEIIVKDRLGSEPRSVLVISSQPLSVGHPDLPALCNLYVEDAGWPSDWDEYVAEVRVPSIMAHAMDEDEASDMLGVLSMLG
jgi:hypothetical protein